MFGLLSAILVEGEGLEPLDGHAQYGEEARDYSHDPEAVDDLVLGATHVVRTPGWQLNGVIKVPKG